MSLTQLFIGYILGLFIGLLICVIVSDRVKSYRANKTRKMYTDRLIAEQDRHMRFKRNQIETRDI